MYVILVQKKISHASGFLDVLSVPLYLDWLVRQITQRGGKVLRDRPYESLQDAIDAYRCDILINCSGNGAKTLTDVRDTNMYTVRGQTVLVEAPHIMTQYYRDGEEGKTTYIIPRGDGTVICGGTMDTENFDLNPDPVISERILRNCYKLAPEINHHKGVEAFKILSYNVGFRPGRKGGIRLEKELRGK